MRLMKGMKEEIYAIQMSIIIQECYLAIIHLFLSNSILNYFGSISIGNYLFCGSVWQEVHKLEHHWHICITCHDKDVGLEGNFQLSLYLMDEKTEIQKILISWQSHRAFIHLKVNERMRKSIWITTSLNYSTYVILYYFGISSRIEHLCFFLYHSLISVPVFYEVNG